MYYMCLFFSATYMDRGMKPLFISRCCPPCLLSVGLQSAARSSSAVSRWWLSTRYCRWPPSTTIIRRPHVRHPTHRHSSWPSIIRSRWTTSVQQSTRWTSSSQHFPWTASSSVKDAFVSEPSQVPSHFSF